MDSQHMSVMDQLADLTENLHITPPIVQNPSVMQAATEYEPSVASTSTAAQGRNTDGTKRPPTLERMCKSEPSLRGRFDRPENMRLAVRVARHTAFACVNHTPTAARVSRSEPAVDYDSSVGISPSAASMARDEEEVNNGMMDLMMTQPHMIVVINSTAFFRDLAAQEGEIGRLNAELMDFHGGWVNHAVAAPSVLMMASTSNAAGGMPVQPADLEEYFEEEIVMEYVEASYDEGDGDATPNMPIDTDSESATDSDTDSATD